MSELNRRSFFRWGLGALGTLSAGTSIARVCGVDTASQPVGPFFPKAGTPEDPIHEHPNPSVPLHLANDNDLTRVAGRDGQASGQVVRVVGQLTDEACRPIANATIVIWQASESGRYNHKGDASDHDFVDPRDGHIIQRKLDPGFQYWGRAVTDAQGNYSFKTVVPGFYPADLQEGWFRPPHIHFLVTATGFAQLVTQMYFSGPRLRDNAWIQSLNARDAILQDRSLSAEQRKALVVEFAPQAGVEELVGRFDIVLNR